MRRAVFYDRIDFIDGKIAYIIEAHRCTDNQSWNPFDCYKEFLDGTCYYRNIYYSGMGGGYLVVPNEEKTYKDKWGYHHDFDEEWFGTNPIYIYGQSRPITNMLIFNKYKYLIKKYHNRSNRELFSLMRIYDEHPEIEFLVDNNQCIIAQDKRLWKMNKNKLNDVLKYIRKYAEEYPAMNLGDVLYAIKHGNLDYKDVAVYKKSKGDIKAYELYKNDWRLYEDYKKLCEELHKDLNDPYWRYPKNLKEKHDELGEQIEAIQKAKEKERNEKLNAILSDISKKVKMDTEINEFFIHVPVSVDEIKYQAEKLHQCLIYANYHEKMANKECLLVLITKNNEPYATYELNINDARVEQAYCDEINRSKCNVPEEEKNIFDKYFATFKNKIRRRVFA